MLLEFLCIIVLTNGEMIEETDNRIVGGRPALPNSIPWQILIEKKNITNGLYDFFCGGSIVSTKFVLTAGHCLYLFLETDLWVIAGAHKIEDRSEMRRQRLSVIKKILHPDYIPYGEFKKHDIALMQVEDPGFDFASHSVQPANLPSAGGHFQLKSGTTCIVSGWGTTQTKDTSNQLLMVDVPVLPNNYCIKIWGDVFAKGHKICASSPGKDSCSGDSGGPLMCQSANRQIVVAGLVSFGASACGHKSIPGVYTDVASYMDWIRQNIN